MTKKRHFDPQSVSKVTFGLKKSLVSHFCQIESLYKRRKISFFVSFGSNEFSHSGSVAGRVFHNSSKDMFFRLAVVFLSTVGSFGKLIMISATMVASSKNV